MSEALRANLSGEAADAIATFYDALPSLPRDRWPEMLHGVGYNFEYYDALFAMVVANVQLSLLESDYSVRQETMQAALLPFCSEFGIEPGRALHRTHRALYADFFAVATGTPLPERYPASETNAWLDVSRRWTERMRQRIDSKAEVLPRAQYALGYYWTIEHLSIVELTVMRTAWAGMGIEAAYLDAHCAVEEEHDAWATRALKRFVGETNPLVGAAIRDHESDLGGYYRELATLLKRDATPHR